MQRNMDAEIRKADGGEWVITWHNSDAWDRVVDVIGEKRTIGTDGSTTVSRDEAKHLRLSLTASGLACVCDASLTYGN